MQIALQAAVVDLEHFGIAACYFELFVENKIYLKVYKRERKREEGGEHIFSHITFLIRVINIFTFASKFYSLL